MTTTMQDTMQRALDRANPNEVADLLKLTKLGHHLANTKVVAAGLTAAASFDVTTAAVRTASTITGLSLDTGENLPAIGVVKTLRVTTVGTAAAGARLVTDAGGTASATVALLSDDGKTLTFEGTVTGFVLEYMARSFTDMTANYP